MLAGYLRSLYQDAMGRAYAAAYDAIGEAIAAGDGPVLDCGAGDGHTMALIGSRCGIDGSRLSGIEWGAGLVAEGRRRGHAIIEGNLDTGLPEESDRYQCVYALSVLEHLLYPCRFLRECQRVLRPGGRLVLLTPNISTYFTAALILAGRMPSSGPHPDSAALVQAMAPIDPARAMSPSIVEGETPEHRHLVVFSYSALARTLALAGFRDIRGRGFGHYPFPRFMQGALERIDPWHCHQMVFVATR